MAIAGKGKTQLRPGFKYVGLGMSNREIAGLGVVETNSSDIQALSVLEFQICYFTAQRPLTRMSVSKLSPTVN